MSIVPNQNILRVNETESVNLTCLVDSYPIEFPTWRDSQMRKLVADSKSTRTYSSYILSRAKRTDNGTLYCSLVDKPDVFLQVDLIVQSILNISTTKKYTCI